MNLDPIILAELQRGGPPLWVAGRTYRASQCVLSPTDWQVYMRATNGVGAIDPKNDGDNWVRWGAAIEAAVAMVGEAVLGVSGQAAAIQATVNAINAAKGIKSVQRGVTTPSTIDYGNGYFGSDPVVVTIAAVNPAKTMINLTSMRVGTGVNKLRLLSGTQLEVTSYSEDAIGKKGKECAWEVIEWN